MMELNNINLWFAKDENNNIITIDKANKNNRYFCPICGSEVIPKALESELVSPHFAHINREECGGESFVHWWTKNNLLKEGDVFSIFTNEEKQYLCKSVQIEKPYDTPFGIYKPDITIECYSGEIIFLEVGLTNTKKKSNYIDRWRHLNNIVIEFNMKNVYNLETLEVNINNRFQAIYYEGLKIYESDKNYKVFKNKITSMEKYKDQLGDIEWFIDDIYEYKMTKEDYRLDGIINEIGYIKDNYTYEHSLLVEDILKTKCNSVMKDIVLRKDKIFHEIINENIKKMGYEYKIECEKFEDERLVWDRLHGEVIYKISVFFKNNPNIYQFVNIERDNNVSAHNGKFYKEYRLSIDRCDKLKNDIKSITDDKINLDEIQKNIYLHESMYSKIMKEKIYPRSCEYKINITTYLKDFFKTQIDNSGIKTHEYSLVNFLIDEINLCDFKLNIIQGVSFVDVNDEFNIRLINKIKLSLENKINYISKLKKIKDCLREDYCCKLEGFNITDNGCNFSLGQNTNVSIDSLGVVRINNLINIVNLGEEYIDNIEESSEVLSEFLLGHITSGYTKEQISKVNKLKYIYENITTTKFLVTLIKDNIIIKNRFERLICKANINKSWETIIKEVSDKVREYIYR